ncbi:unnamed protein product [Lampetra planeri]
MWRRLEGGMAGQLGAKGSQLGAEGGGRGARRRSRAVVVVVAVVQIVPITLNSRCVVKAVRPAGGQTQRKCARFAPFARVWARSRQISRPQLSGGTMCQRRGLAEAARGARAGEQLVPTPYASQKNIEGREKSAPNCAALASRRETMGGRGGAVGAGAPANGAQAGSRRGAALSAPRSPRPSP